MKKLSATKIYRGGITAPYNKEENTECFIYTLNEETRSGKENVTKLRLRFDMASKGGGTTEVEVEIGESGIEDLLLEIANRNPRSALLLSKAALKAVEYDANAIGDTRELERKANSLFDFFQDIIPEDESKQSYGEKNAKALLSRIYSAIWNVSRSSSDEDDYSSR